MRILLLCLFCAITAQTATAQGHIGFKTGLNFAQIKGPADVNAAGAEIETYDRSTGFHIGMTYTYEFVDAFRVRAEFLYSRKGGKYKHIGQMHRTFYSATNSIVTVGEGSYLVNVNNSYFELPVSAVFRYKKIEASAGLYGGLLGLSAGEGALSYKGATIAGTATDQYDFILDHNYFQDEVGGVTPGTAVINATLDGKPYQIAKTQGAYYNNATGDTEKLFKRLDYGLIAGAAWYFNGTLSLGARLQYGLADLTNNQGHYSLSRLDANNKPILRNTNDRNFTIQTSVAFSF
jgi:Outer membrane protein beta-barrel domain